MTPYGRWIIPDWPAPTSVRALVTTRAGGASTGRYASFNLGDHVNDDPALVARNRAILRNCLPAEPKWIQQVHGIEVVDADWLSSPTEADASVARRAGTVCAVLTADCLPLLLCNTAGTVVAAAHAGWRGLCAGIVEATVTAMDTPGNELLAYLGPAIGPESYEVGNDVRDTFVGMSPSAAAAFKPHPSQKWLADLYHLARQRLWAVGVQRIYGGDSCTLKDRERFFSFRRDGETGRMASLIWFELR